MLGLLGGFISTLQSSFHSFYGLMVVPLTFLHDFNRNRKQIVTTASSTNCSIPEEDTIDSSSSDPHCDTISSSVEFKEPPNCSKPRVINMMFKDGLACWHFLSTLLHLIKRAVAVKINIVEPDKIVLNQRRVINLSNKLHETMFKHS